jgi:hypothetical protein
MIGTDDPTAPHPDHAGSTRTQGPFESGPGMAAYARLTGGEADGRARNVEEY